MGKAAFDAKLAAIDSLRSAEAAPRREAALAKALADRNNYIAACAARVAGETHCHGLIPALEAAFARFLADPVKTDPQCWAKTAIVQALAALDSGDPGVFLSGLRHVQLEPVWGGREDTAGRLRAASAGALAGCRGIADLDALEHLTETLLDPDKTVRAAAARAVGRFERREAGLLLRARALAGESEFEAAGALFGALLEVEGRRAIPFLGRFLGGDGEMAQEAALALGGTHEPAAFELLRAALAKPAAGWVRPTLLAAIALTRLAEAFDLLLEEAEAGRKDAAHALEEAPLDERRRERLEKTLRE